MYLKIPLEILPGNFYIGKGLIDDVCFEIRYVVNDKLFLQTLIDEIWAENKIWDDRDLKNKERNILYLCHKNIIIEQSKVIIDEELNLSTKFKKTTKYFYPVDEFIENQLISIISHLPNKLVSGLKPRIQKEKLPFTVITTVFNNSKLLEQTIQSVINQSYQDFEYIVKDAGSTDDFQKIIEKYRPYISKIISKPDKGIYYGMHEGIENSNGEYIAILNSDDIYFSPKILDYYADEIKHTHADAYYANMLMKSIFKNSSFIRIGKIKNIYRESCINHSTLFLKRTCYNKVGGFDFSFKIAADGDLIIKLIKTGCKFQYLNETMVLFRLGGASTFSFRSFKENIICRYKYKKLNILGYLFVIMQSAKALLIRYVKNKT